ncbi:MAG TPA: hypothetical protein VGV38_02815 [Pyrinomonadaceae bacterium]|nr:hypothetical protein [Pyrinomonadaceae bacterium]
MSAALEEILEEAKALPPEEQRQLREVWSREDLGQALAIMLAAGLLFLLEKRKALTPDELPRLQETLNRVALDSGVVSRAEVVREVSGKYAHLPTGSEAFASQKREEVEREARR